MKSSARASAAAWLSAASYRKVLGANERVRAGLIGIGLIGKRHLLDFMAQPDVDIAAICEVYEPRLEEGVATSGGKAERFKDFRKMLERKDVDAVVVSTPDHWHALMTIMACAAGKDVYVEKPLTLFVKEGRWMIEAARQYKRIVQVGTQQRSGTPFQKCRELIRGGHIGDLRSVRMSSCRNILPGFASAAADGALNEEDWKMWLGPAPYVTFDKNRCIYHFRWFWDYSGGQTTNLLAHEIDIVHWVTQQLPQSVAAMGGRYSLKGIGETPDIFEALFQYKDFIASWSCREIAGRTAARGGTEFVGTAGTLAVSRAGLEVFPDTVIPPDDQIPQFMRPRRRQEGPPVLRTTALKLEGFEQVKDQFQPHVRNFVDCIKSLTSPCCGAMPKNSKGRDL
ncbi:MAG: Gfo/Idh/MocA family oxidoreductase [Acidobacteria bacterium]|nr:Gfo/Idh/MocA family oxidoreductase [Acidobacteriota bacterium]MCI0626805.1 Gfo/Idh/MocA family oxidoreductase [Acidobacteriota bacterium]